MVALETEGLTARRVMIEQHLKGRGIRDERVLAAFDKVPRHLFVPESLRFQAYADYPLPIGDAQTISQPYIVALMAEQLRLTPEAKVLDVGTGSGYQAAILSQLCRFVYSVERVPALANRAKIIIDQLGYHNVSIKLGDGWEGWREFAPYDAIVVAACSEEVPLTLFDQLKDGGRMIVPIGPVNAEQELMLFIRHAKSPPQRISLGSCSFVPFVKKK